MRDRIGAKPLQGQRMVANTFVDYSGAIDQWWIGNERVGRRQTVRVSINTREPLLCAIEASVWPW